MAPIWFIMNLLIINKSLLCRYLWSNFNICSQNYYWVKPLSLNELYTEHVYMFHNLFRQIVSLHNSNKLRRTSGRLKIGVWLADVLPPQTRTNIRVIRKKLNVASRRGGYLGIHTSELTYHGGNTSYKQQLKSRKSLGLQRRNLHSCLQNVQAQRKLH